MVGGGSTTHNDGGTEGQRQQLAKVREMTREKPEGVSRCEREKKSCKVLGPPKSCTWYMSFLMKLEYHVHKFHMELGNVCKFVGTSVAPTHSNLVCQHVICVLGTQFIPIIVILDTFHI